MTLVVIQKCKKQAVQNNGVYRMQEQHAKSISKPRKSNLQTHLSSNRSEPSLGTRLQTYPDGHQAFLFKHAANDNKSCC